MKPGRPERNILSYGEEKEPAPILYLKAGPVNLVFEAGFLRYLKVGTHEFLRMIYFAVRDHNWETIEGAMEDLIIHEEEDSFRIGYTSVHRKGPVAIVFKCLIRGDRKGLIEFSIEGKAGSTFKKNRIGFCVLHPIAGCIGKPCSIEHENGIQSDLRFPVGIVAHQPFKDINSMRWEVNENYEAKMAFYGDVFETEDQRNWTDASYKTYCTPLDIPFPVTIRTGDTISQKVVLEMITKTPGPSSHQEEEMDLSFSIGKETGFIMPGLGTGASSGYDQLDIDSIEKIKSLQLEHVRYDLPLRKEGDLLQRIRFIQQEVNILNTKACLALFFDKDPEREYAWLVNTVNKYPFPIGYIMLFSRTTKTTPDFLIKRLVGRMREDFPEALLGGGTNAYFAELNRERIEHRPLDFVVYSINPQVHASDHASLIETLEIQAHTVRNARSFTEGKYIVVSPVTLKPRENPNATSEESPPFPGELPTQVDVRQMSFYAACWTLISIKYLAEAGVKTITYFEAAGWRGLIQGPKTPSLPLLFKAAAGDIFPIYLIFRWLKEVKNGIMVRSYSSDPLLFDGLAIKQHGIHHIFLVNFSREVKVIQIKNMSGPYLVRSISVDNIYRLMKDEKELVKILPVEVNKIIMQPCSIQWINQKNEIHGS